MSKQRYHTRSYRRRARYGRLQLPRYSMFEGLWHVLYPPGWITAGTSWLTLRRRAMFVAAMLALMALVAFFILLGNT